MYLPFKTSRNKANFEARMVGDSRVMTELKKHLQRVSIVDSTVFITGETGTGKDDQMFVIRLEIMIRLATNVRT